MKEMMVAGAEELIHIVGKVGVIEAKWWASDANTQKVVVICHPHPLYSGTMDNKVVTTLARAWRDKGYSVLRFNFRGVGGSEGHHDQGVGESEDLGCIVGWLRGQGYTEPIDLAGFSFGAWVATRYTAQQEKDSQQRKTGGQPRLLVLVAPPVHYEGFAQLHPIVPTLVLQGEDDDVVEPAMVYEWVATRQQQPELVKFVGAGHFFHGRLIELKQVVMAHLP